MTPEANAEWQEIYKALNQDFHWFNCASKLKRAGNLLFNAHLASLELSPNESDESRSSDINDVATLLYGLAMENVLKAILLKEGVAKIKSNGEIDWKTNSNASSKNAHPTTDHDLLGMCSFIKSINLNADQENLVTRLSAFVYWAGKYPTPKELMGKTKAFKGLLLSKQPNAAEFMLPQAFEPVDKRMFDGIYEILDQRSDQVKIISHRHPVEKRA